eukprot:SAG22_NODE_75_length_22256_cov_45.062960_11_plen_221_part_00
MSLCLLECASLRDERLTVYIPEDDPPDMRVLLLALLCAGGSAMEPAPAPAPAAAQRLTEDDCPLQAVVRYGEVFQYGAYLSSQNDGRWEFNWDARTSEVVLDWDTETNSIEDWEGYADGVYYRYPFDQPNEHVMQIIQMHPESTAQPAPEPPAAAAQSPAPEPRPTDTTSGENYYGTWQAAGQTSGQGASFTSTSNIATVGHRVRAGGSALGLLEAPTGV